MEEGRPLSIPVTFAILISLLRCPVLRVGTGRAATSTGNDETHYSRDGPGGILQTIAKVRCSFGSSYSMRSAHSLTPSPSPTPCNVNVADCLTHASVPESSPARRQTRSHVRVGEGSSGAVFLAQRRLDRSFPSPLEQGYWYTFACFPGPLQIC